jgi:hypothetical protein
MYHNNGRVINKQVEAEGRTSPVVPYKGRVPSRRHRIFNRDLKKKLDPAP